MKTCYELLRDVLLDAFDVPTIYFKPPYEDYRKIDRGIRAAVWSNYDDEQSRIQFMGQDRHTNRILIVRSNLGFYNVIVFWDSGEQLEFFSIGPFRNDELAPAYFTQILKDAQILPAQIRQMKQIYESMPYIQVDIIVNVTKHIVGNFIPEFKTLTPEQLEYADQRRPVEIHMDVIERNFLEFSEQYADLFHTFLKYLRIGDNVRSRDALHRFIRESQLATKKTMRNYKSLLTMLNHFCHMALLETSVHPSYSLQLANTINMRIEETTSLTKLEQMPNDICHKYCLLIKNYAYTDYTKLTREVIAYIRLHLDEELTLSDIAAHFGKNPSMLSGSFSEDTGQTLTSFIQQARIDEALRLFNSTDMSVSDVAVAVGYQDFSYFSKIFSKNIGISPRDYRKRGLKK